MWPFQRKKPSKSLMKAEKMENTSMILVPFIEVEQTFRVLWA